MSSHKSLIQKKSFDIYGHLTSISLESEFWEALKEIAQKETVSVRSLVLKIDEERLKSQSEEILPNLSSRLRVFILNYYRKSS